MDYVDTSIVACNWYSSKSVTRRNNLSNSFTLPAITGYKNRERKITMPGTADSEGPYVKRTLLTRICHTIHLKARQGHRIYMRITPSLQ